MKKANEQLADKFAVYEDIGLIIRYARGITKIIIDEQICSFCKVREEQHVVKGKSIMNHPFFHNNLEYLEWKYELHEKHVGSNTAAI